jgi:hypothetical protein
MSFWAKLRQNFLRSGKKKIASYERPVRVEPNDIGRPFPITTSSPDSVYSLIQGQLKQTDFIVTQIKKLQAETAESQKETAETLRQIKENRISYDVEKTP